MFNKYIIFLSIFIIFFSCIFSYDNNSYYFPSDYLTITSNYGYRQLWKNLNFHNGTDFGAPQNTNVYSISSGVVSYVGFYNGYGNTIIITHQNGMKSLYGHLGEKFLVSLGDKVTQHQLIGTVGPTILSNGIRNGNTTGPHLHLTIFNSSNSTIDPLTLNMKKATN